MTDTQKGYVNYYEVLELDESAKPGDVRRAYKRKMKDLVFEIHRAQSQAELTDDRRNRYLLEMAKLNAALYILRDNDLRESYVQARREVMELERRWREAAERGEDTDALRRQFDNQIRGFLSRYVEEAMLDAGRDRECVEASGWDAAHERHASRILRHYRHGLYHDILERLPYHEVTPPRIDWEERRRTVAAILEGVSA